jgi:hypothetical protein
MTLNVRITNSETLPQVARTDSSLVRTGRDLSVLIIDRNS